MRTILKFIFSFWIVIVLCFSQIVTAGDKDDNCIELNTNVPFIWKKICTDWWSAQQWEWTNVNAETAFPTLMWWLTKIVIWLIIAFSFLMPVAWWIMIASSWADQSLYWKWKDLIMKVIIWIILLWLSGIILHAINPNFFK